MFKKILIANRGEIAVRIIRTCKEMGIKTVAVYSETDKNALHVQLADESVCIGPDKAKDSYLNEKNILSATVLKGAEAIHPGFGFLSENSKFARMCEECNIAFIGPDFSNIELMGNKSNAREVMKKAGIPIVPGSDGVINEYDDALKIAEKMGYPVMIKASSGGGGRGIRIVHKKEDLKNAFNTAKAEAKACFGDSSMYIEKFIKNPKHIEVQILGDKFGNVIYLGERDCSIQRRNQKIIEEAPGATISKELRNKMGEVAVRAAKYINYKNAGTIEFLLDEDNKFYFMEMNTRIQVEHGITEMICDVDLIKEQINIASGKELTIKQSDVEIRGHAIECRINAEDSSKNFMPCPGEVKYLNLPGGLGIRVDTAIYSGYEIPPSYDSMVAKIIAYAPTRFEAIKKMERALSELIIDGIETNINFHLEILNNENFLNGEFSTKFIDKEFGHCF